MAFHIIIDGENFIHRLEDDFGYSKDEILNEFTFENFIINIQMELKKQRLESHPYLHTEFVYPDEKKLGNCFVDNKKDKALTRLLDKIRNSKGVSLHPVKLKNKSNTAKGVDMEVAVCMFNIAVNSFLTKYVHNIVLVARDRDYVPALKYLRNLSVHTIVVAPKEDRNKKDFPKEVINETYHFISLREICDKCLENRRKK